jgi:hypothetical protein
MIPSQTSPQGVPEDHVQHELISWPSLIVKNNHREDNFRRKKTFAWLLVQISYERNQKGFFYIFSYTRNYEQSDRLDSNCISHQLSNDNTLKEINVLLQVLNQMSWINVFPFSLMSKMDWFLSIGHVHIHVHPYIYKIGWIFFGEF